MDVEVRATRRATRRQFATNEPTLSELQEHSTALAPAEYLTGFQNSAKDFKCISGKAWR